MIYFPSTKANISTEFPVAVDATIDAEGIALIADTTGGVFGLKAATGAGSEIFFGIAVSQQTSLDKATKTEALVQGTNHKVTTAFTPVAGTVGVYDATDGAMLVITTDWTLSGKVITLEADTDGHDLVVTYKYTPNANQARALQGDIVPGGPAGAALGQIGCIRNGIVFTDQFDSSKDWTAAGIVVKTASSGQFTIGGSGTTLSNVSVIQAPSAGFPYLGLMLK